MRPSNQYRNPEISQYGDQHFPTNKYGEKFGILHLPGNRFTYGRNLVEMSDRGDSLDHLITSYAASYYDALGRTQTVYDNSGLINNLRELLSPASKYRVDGETLSYISATGTIESWENVDAGSPQWVSQLNASGKLVVADGVTVSNNGVSVNYTAGPSKFGTIGYASELTGTPPEGEY